MRRARSRRAIADLPRIRQLTFAVEFCDSPEGLQLNRAFVKIADAKVRRKLIDLVKALSTDDAD